MFIVLRPITAKIRACKKSQNYNLITFLTCGLVSYAQLACFLQQNNIPKLFLVFMVFQVWWKNLQNNINKTKLKKQIALTQDIYRILTIEHKAQMTNFPRF